MMTDNECLTCRSISGEQRISPGPTIHTGKHWLVEHAYPCALEGWLVIVLKRHASALHELSGEEFAELAPLLERTAHALSSHLQCEKEYIACFGEAPGFNHVHFHVIPKTVDLSPELRGPAVFGLLKPDRHEPVAPDRVRALCERLRDTF
jgi:diadenosine tetraphosphate (Ap4A) HIT family hydrolase